ncbi:hypothetical protein D3C76_1063880 [compost metagenome]
MPVADDRFDACRVGDCTGLAHLASSLCGVPVQAGGVLPGRGGVLFVPGGDPVYRLAVVCPCCVVLVGQGWAP